MASKQPPKIHQFQYKNWTFTSVKSHILNSEGAERDRFETNLRLPHVPEMIFHKNMLRVDHADGYGIEFNPLDALKLVDAQNDTIKVHGSSQWLEARAESDHIREVVKPFDWTFTTSYTGTLFGKEGSEIQMFDTNERIDIEKLKVTESILYYADVLMYEDELADNGRSLLNAKIRVMPSGFFILLRFYLRVDNVLIRINDTRIHHEFDRMYFLREHTCRESRYNELMIPPHLYTDPNEISAYLQLKHEKLERLQLPASHIQYVIEDKPTPMMVS